MLYIKSELFALLDSDDIDNVRFAVQKAIELEHSTMPPYLFALYSLGATNRPIRTILGSIVKEEMLHMLLACNLLNAIGGAPNINSPNFVQAYPTHLPGTVNTGLVVPLKPFSKTLVETVFMEIEEPETPLSFPVMTLADLDLPPSRTIGQFYGRIKDKLETLGAAAFTGDPARQVSTPEFEAILPETQQTVTDLKSAVAAIEFIVEQGEGTAEEPDLKGELAHYYKFAEISKGRTLIVNPNATATSPPQERYIYGGDRITIEPGIQPVLENPRSSDYAAGSPERQASDDCNRVYTKILGQLHSAFNGSAGDLQPAIDSMTNDLRPAIRTLMAITLPDGHRAGPTFEYLV
jgi:Ferritin-like